MYQFILLLEWNVYNIRLQLLPLIRICPYTSVNTSSLFILPVFITILKCTKWSFALQWRRKLFSSLLSWYFHQSIMANKVVTSCSPAGRPDRREPSVLRCTYCRAYKQATEEAGLNTAVSASGKRLLTSQTLLWCRVRCMLGPALVCVSVLFVVGLSLVVNWSLSEPVVSSVAFLRS